MRRALSLTMLMLIQFLPLLANAATSTVGNPVANPSSGAGLSSTTFCETIVEHLPKADVAYKPGVDVHGKPVSPADVPAASPVVLPKIIRIPLTLDLAKTLNLNVNQYPSNTLGVGSEVQIGTLSLEGDQVSFNGQPLAAKDQDNLRTACSKISHHP